MASLREVGERSLIKNIISRLRPYDDFVIGDDATVLKTKGDTVISTDTVTFGGHKPPGMTFEQFGWMAAAVNFSDIASMGAKPIGILAALSMPPDMDEERVYDIMIGMDKCAEFCGTHVIGGDAKTGEGSVCGTAVGDMEYRKPMMRSGAVPGDVVAVTGTLGSPAAGFCAIMNGINEKEAKRHLMEPVPRVKEGIAMAETGVKACMDLSDGLSSAVNEICERSGVSIDIDRTLLPKGPGVDNMSRYVSEYDMMMNFGGEYELLITAPEHLIDELRKRMDITVIGDVNKGAGAYLLMNGERTVIRNGGYEHFKDRS